MKKRFTALIGAMGLLVLGGCGGSKSPEEVLKIIGKYADMPVINYGDFNDLRGLDGKCYDFSGESKTCDRIMADVDDWYIFTIRNSSTSESIDGMIEEDKLTGISYYGESGTYFHNFDEDTESAMLEEGDYCTVYLKGKGDDIDEICDDEYNADAKRLKKNYEAMLSDIGISESELKDFLSWYAKDEGKEFMEDLREEKKNQKSLSAGEVKQRLEDGFDIMQKDGSMLLKNKSDSKQVILYFVTDSNSKVMTYDDSTNTDMSLFYYYQSDRVAASEDSKCMYYLDDEKTMKGKTCSQEQITDAELMEMNFDDLLEKQRITLDELFSYFQVYTK